MLYKLNANIFLNLESYEGEEQASIRKFKGVPFMGHSLFSSALSWMNFTDALDEFLISFGSVLCCIHSFF